MRACLALALVVASLVAGDAANTVSAGVRAPQLVVYDSEPGVYVRSYWRRPWQGRHYYPVTGKKPKVGRHENLNAVRAAPKPAQSFYREWSTLSLYPPPVVAASAEQPVLPLK